MVSYSFANSYALPPTTLNGAIDSSVTTITLSALPTGLTGAETNLVIQADAELMLITSFNASPFLDPTVTRGWENTTAASHADTTPVYYRLTKAQMEYAVTHVPDHPHSGSGSDLGGLVDYGDLSGTPAVDAAAGTGSLRTLGTGATQAAAGNDSRLTDARTPTAHAASHVAGADPVADFAASGGSHARGLVPDPGVTIGSTRFLREDATWAVPAGTGGGGGGATEADLLLDFIQTTDLHGSYIDDETSTHTDLVLETWTQWLPNKSFTVPDADADVLIDLILGQHGKIRTVATFPGGHSDMQFRFSVDDGAALIPISGNVMSGTFAAAEGGDYMGVGGGMAVVALAPGSHTVKIEYYSRYQGEAFLRPGTLGPTEFLTLQVVARGGAIAPASGHYEILVTGAAPPEMVTTPDNTDYLYGFVSD